MTLIQKFYIFARRAVISRARQPLWTYVTFGQFLRLFTNKNDSKKFTANLIKALITLDWNTSHKLSFPSLRNSVRQIMPSSYISYTSLLSLPLHSCPIVFFLYSAVAFVLSFLWSLPVYTYANHCYHMYTKVSLWLLCNRSLIIEAYISQSS